MPVVMVKKRVQLSRYGHRQAGEFIPDMTEADAKMFEAAGVVQILEADVGNVPSSSMQSAQPASLPPVLPQEDAISADAGDSSQSESTTPTD